MRELEITVSRLRRLYQEDVENVRDENKKLKEILAAHVIQYDLSAPNQQYASTASNFGGSSTSLSGRASLSTGYTSPPSHTVPPMPAPYSSGGSPAYPSQPPPANPLQPPRNNVHGLDYEEIGLDFVGTYERTPYLSPPPNL
jgi:hypothetical protein